MWSSVLLEHYVFLASFPVSTANFFLLRFGGPALTLCVNLSPVFVKLHGIRDCRTVLSTRLINLHTLKTHWEGVVNVVINNLGRTLQDKTHKTRNK